MIKSAAGGAVVYEQAMSSRPFRFKQFVIHQDRCAMKVGTDAVQLLGGHGFTKEHPVERWYRDLRAIAIQAGGLHL